jgi:histidine ammonia-lyase
MSSNAAGIGHGALVAVDADRLLSASLRVAALSFLAAGADPTVLDPRVQAARGHPGQVAIAERMRKLLGPDVGTVESGRGSQTVHDPYPFRAFAQVKGAELDALEQLEAILSVELNAAGENALVDPEPPEALPTANFHAGVLALGLDRLRAGLAQSASLAAARVSALLDPGLMGLPAALAARPGQDSGAMIVEYTAHAAAADVRLRAGPVAAQTTSVGGGLESHASFAPFAARATQESLDSAAVAVSSELVVAVRALHLRGLAPVAGDAGDLFAAAVERMDDDLSDRPLSGGCSWGRRPPIVVHNEQPWLEIVEPSAARSTSCWLWAATRRQTTAGSASCASPSCWAARRVRCHAPSRRWPHTASSTATPTRSNTGWAGGSIRSPLAPGAAGSWPWRPRSCGAL